jgi:NitT/TauT family transport system ATP-binding protein
VKRVVPVDLPRPRDPASPEFNALKRELTALVMEEQRRHTAAEERGV